MKRDRADRPREDDAGSTLIFRASCILDRFRCGPTLAALSARGLLDMAVWLSEGAQRGGHLEPSPTSGKNRSGPRLGSCARASLPLCGGVPLLQAAQQHRPEGRRLEGKILHGAYKTRPSLPNHSQLARRAPSPPDRSALKMILLEDHNKIINGAAVS